MSESYGDLGLRVPGDEDEASGADVPLSFREFSDSMPAGLAAFLKGDAALSEDGTLKLVDAILQALMPTGTILATACSAAPAGFLLCDGSAVSRTTYKALWEAIKSSGYGVGDGSTTFNVPDLRGRVPVGVDGAANRLSSGDALAAAAGEEKHTLTSAEMPNHQHGGGGLLINFAPVPGQIFTNNNNVADPTPGFTAIRSWIIGSNASIFGATEAAGGGASHNNMQPYQVVNYIIKA